MHRCTQLFAAFIALFACAVPTWAGTIIVTHGNVAASATTCTLAQAIHAANITANLGATYPSTGYTDYSAVATVNQYGHTPVGASTVDPLSYSATSTLGAGNCQGATAGSNTIYFGAALAGTTLNFDTADNYWYGPNALPPIASTIMIDGGPAGIRLQNTNSTRLRFFFIGADPVAGGATPGYNTPGPGNLNLHRMTLSGGRQLGGAGHNAGGGGGMGGALFNQGVLTLDDVTLSGNQATGGSMIYHADPIADPCGIVDFNGNCGWGWTDQLMYGAGGIGEDGGFFIFAPCDFHDLNCTNPPVQSGGMGGAVPRGQASGVDNDQPVLRDGGGLHSGFGGNEPPPETAAFGGNGGGAGGNIPGSANPDGPGGGGFRGGGNFGVGGITKPAKRAQYPQYGSGGSVGGGGAGGGFGGGARVLGAGGFGGYRFEYIHSAAFFQAAGGFGGGGIGVNPAPPPAPQRIGGAGAGLGGAIFNHFGTVTLRNSTLVGNRAQGGASILGNGHGFGGAVFNLNGVLTSSFSTLAGNTAESGGAIYSLGYNAIARTASPNAGSSSAVLNLNNSILAGSVTDTATAASDLVLSLPPKTAGGPNVATVSINPSGKNLVMQAVNDYDAPALPTFALTANPLLGALANNSGPTQTALPGSGSPVIDAADACTGAAGGNNGADQRGVPRPQGARCDLGAVEVVPVPLAQTITGFAATPANPAYAPSATFTVSATGGASGNPVTFSIAAGSTSVCSINTNTVNTLSAGTCTVLANQAGSPTVYAAAPQATLAVTIGKAAQTLSFTSTAPASASVGGATYTPSATSSVGLTPVVLSIAASASGVCSLNAGAVSFIGAGSCVINANQAGNGNYNAAAQVQQTFTVGKGTQTLSFTSNAPTAATVGGATYTPIATSSAGVTPVTLSIAASASGVCSLNAGVVSFIGAGSCVINANQAGNTNYNAAAQVQQTFTVGKGTQTLSFTSTAPGSASVGGTTYTPIATSNAGVTPVTLSIAASASGVCSLNAGVVSFIGAGSCVINANQAGNTNYNAAAQAQQTFTVGKGTQTLSFISTAPTAAIVGGATYTPTATSSAGLTPVALSIATSASSVCSLNAGVVSFNGVGSCVINANQAGNTNYNAAAQVQQTFTVGKGTQTLSFTSTAPAGASVGGATYTPSATSSAGLTPVVLSIAASASGVCSLSAGAVSFIGAGSCVINADQAGNGNYNAAAQVQQTFTVGKGDQTLSFNSAAPTAATVGGATYTPTATSSAGLTPVVLSIAASANGVCSLDAGAVSFVGAGSCVINADQAGNTNYNAAAQVQQTFTVGKGTQTLSFTSAAPTGASVGGATYTPSATSSAGLTPVILSIAASASGVCSLSAGAVSFIGAGSCVINADQAGDANYNAAARVQQTFTVATANSSTALTSSPASPVFGQSVTFNATVTGANPTGNVSFVADGATTLCAAVALAGTPATADCATAVLSAGNHEIVASYSGDASNTSSVSAALQISVGKQSTTTVLTTACMTTFVENQPFSLAATVVGAGTNPGGTMTFDNGATALCAKVPTSSAGATCSIDNLAVAGPDTQTTYGLTARYSGDGNHASSVSSLLMITVLSAADVILRDGWELPSLSCPIE